MAGLRMRRLRGMEILFRGGQVKQFSESCYIVCSQHGNGAYRVRRRDETWLCECPDYEKRKAYCKHIFAVILLLGLPQTLASNSEVLASSHGPIHRTLGPPLPMKELRPQ